MKNITIKNMMKSFLTLILLLTSVVSQATVDPFSIYVRTTYPPTVATVSDAAHYVLAPTGYRFVDEYPAPLDAQKIGMEKIPPIAKVHRTMTIIDALQLLVGQQHYIVIDRNNRLVSFTRNP